MSPVRDEGPSPEDLRRFGGETAFCPDCGAQIWDQADVCPRCYAYLGGETARHRSRAHRERRHRWRKLVMAIVLVAMLLSLAGFSGLLQAILR